MVDCIGEYTQKNQNTKKTVDFSKIGLYILPRAAKCCEKFFGKLGNVTKKESEICYKTRMIRKAGEKKGDQNK